MALVRGFSSRILALSFKPLHFSVTSSGCANTWHRAIVTYGAFRKLDPAPSTRRASHWLSIKNHVMRLHIVGRGVWFHILPFAPLRDPPVPARRECYAQIAGSIGPCGTRRRSHRMFESQSLQPFLAPGLLLVRCRSAKPNRRVGMLRSLRISDDAGPHDDVGSLLPVSRRRQASSSST